MTDLILHELPGSHSPTFPQSHSLESMLKLGDCNVYKVRLCKSRIWTRARDSSKLLTATKLEAYNQLRKIDSNISTIPRQSILEPCSQPTFTTRKGVHGWVGWQGKLSQNRPQQKQQTVEYSKQRGKKNRDRGGKCEFIREAKRDTGEKGRKEGRKQPLLSPDTGAGRESRPPESEPPILASAPLLLRISSAKTALTQPLTTFIWTTELISPVSSRFDQQSQTKGTPLILHRHMLVVDDSGLNYETGFVTRRVWVAVE